MDNQALTLLSPEQLNALSDELKAVFTLLPPSDQEFFARTFKPADLPTALGRKAEIIKRNQSQRERLAQIQAELAQSAAQTPVNEKADEVVGALAGVLGVGAAAAVVATDNTAHYRGVQPCDLLDALRAEFGGGKTNVQFGGAPQAMTATVLLLGASGPVPAMTILLNSVADGLEVKVNDLTTRGVLETVKESGKKLINVAGDVVDLIARGQRGLVSPGDLIGAVEQGAGLAETAAALKLKERAWKVIRQAAESVEAVYLSRLEQERAARIALEKAWDNHYQCPTCGVAFGAEDRECRVCATARPAPPARPDPRAAP